MAEEVGPRAEAVKARLKALALKRFAIGHTTLELERPSARCEGEDAQLIGHHVGAAHAHAPQLADR